MTRQGQYNYKGINAQAYAAMSLFLQYLRDPKFSYVHLEAPKLADFVLVFNDGHKIICESKDWEQKFSFFHLKKVLNSLLKRATIGENDEILIICTNLDEELEEKVRNIKYFYKLCISEFKRKKFTDQQIAVLNRTKFWRVYKKFNRKIIYSLFSELINFWLPQEEINRIIDSILMKKIYEGSEKGARFSREDIISEIESLRDEVIKRSGYIDTQRRKVEDILKELGIAIDDPKSAVWSKGQLSALSAQPQLMFFVLDRLRKRKINNLQEWDELWQLYKIYRFSFTLFKIFENNLHTEENKRYILRFFKDNISKIRKFYYDDFFDIDIVKITKNILDQDRDSKFIKEAFEIVKKLIAKRRDDIFYLKSRRDDFWEREEIAKLLKEIYNKSDPDLKNKIYKFIVKTYNLIEDEGDFSRYTPQKIFEILKDWLGYDFEKRLFVLKKQLARQYDDFYRKKFNGWELSGGLITFWEHDYKASDRHFVLFTLRPALMEYHKKNPMKAWQFIRRNCITPTSRVSKNRPDFLNRASIPVILERYKSDDEEVSKEAFNILRQFILSPKGIPLKVDLIYQEINTHFPDDKKWELLKLTIDKYKLPVNPFVEQISLELAEKRNKQAKETIKGWLRNPDYYKRGTIFETNVVGIISKFLDFCPEEGIEIFKEIVNRGFINKIDSFEVFDLAKSLSRIIHQNPSIGIKILNNLAQKDNLSENEQILLCSSLVAAGESEQEDGNVLIKIYEQFLDSFLKDLGNDIKEIKKKITRSQSREAIVEFADALAKHKKIKEALRIIKIFINDPDPYLPGKDPEDPENKYNQHQKILDGEKPHIITSVRGRCAWVLPKCVVLEGRDYINDIIELTKQLAIGKDRKHLEKNWYVKHMACFALSRLAQVRLSVMPDNKNILFFDDNKEKALEKAKKVEDMAFELLREIAAASNNVKKSLGKSILQVFNHIRALNEEDALRFINTFIDIETLKKKFPDEVIGEAAPLFIFFAEFRRDAFKNWRWKTDKYYNDLAPSKYNAKKFKRLLCKIIDVLEPNERFPFGAQFERLIRDAKPGSKDGERMFKIAYRYLNYLSKNYEHEIFRIIYMSIKEGMEKKWHFDKWYKLYVKCLKKEKRFYDKNFDKQKTMEMYWWPSVFNEDILTLIYEQGGEEKFLEAFDIITSFPRELQIYDSDKVISLLKKCPKTTGKTRKIVNRLFKRNPSKYYDLRNKWIS